MADRRCIEVSSCTWDAWVHRLARGAVPVGDGISQVAIVSGTIVSVAIVSVAIVSGAIVSAAIVSVAIVGMAAR